MVIGTALGFTDWGTIALAVALAFLFGYPLTCLPLLRGGPRARGRHPDRARVRHLDRGHGVVDNAIILVVPGAMEAGLGDSSSGARSRSRCPRRVFAVPVNRWLIARGRGHAVSTDRHPRRSLPEAGRLPRRDRLRLRLRRVVAEALGEDDEPPAPHGAEREGLARSLGFGRVAASKVADALKCFGRGVGMEELRRRCRRHRAGRHRPLAELERCGSRRGSRRREAAVRRRVRRRRVDGRGPRSRRGRGGRIVDDNATLGVATVTTSNGGFAADVAAARASRSPPCNGT